MENWDERVRRVAREIEHYLEMHPQSADSLEGIATWWVSRQRIRSELALVHAALEALAAQGIVTTGNKNDTRGPVYRLKQDRH